MPKRANFCNIQLSHHVPCENGEASRVRTGYEQVVAHRTSSDFAHVAKEDGTVTEINHELNMVKVRYKSGEEDIVRFGNYQGTVDGIYMNHHIVLNDISQGTKLKRGDIVAYNSGFFAPVKGTKQVEWKHGVHANVMILENDDTIEDSSTISRRLGQKLKMTPTHMRPIKLSKKTVLHDIVKVGDEVTNVDVLCVIEDEDISDLSIVDKDNQESFDMIVDLNKKTPKAKHSGHIIDIDVFYSCPIEEMHPSLAKVVRKIVTYQNKKNNMAKDTIAASKFPAVRPVPKGTKLKALEFDDDSVILMIYISEDLDCGIGDKIVFDSSLKSVCSGVMDEPLISESGVEIDAKFSPLSISNRIVNSPLRQGGIERVLEYLEVDVTTEFFK